MHGPGRLLDLAAGADAYESLEAKAGALLHSLACNRALVDGNKPLAIAATIAFLELNGHRLTLTNDRAYTLVITVAAGQLERGAAGRRRGHR